jgi:hypothetical protein
LMLFLVSPFAISHARLRNSFNAYFIAIDSLNDTDV